MDETSGLTWVADNMLDLFVVAVISLSSVFAFYRGFVRESLAIAGWIGAGVLTWRFFPFGQKHVRAVIETDWLADVVAGAAMFICTLVVVWLCIHAVVSRVRQSPLNSLDRSLGFLFGVTRGVLIVVVLYIIASRAAWREEDSVPLWVVDAHTYGMVDNTAAIVMRIIPEGVLNLPAIGFREVQNQAEELRDTKEQLDELRRFAEPTVSQPERADDAPGYNKQETENMDRLIDNLQNDPIREEN